MLVCLAFSTAGNGQLRCGAEFAYYCSFFFFVAPFPSPTISRTKNKFWFKVIILIFQKILRLRFEVLGEPDTSTPPAAENGKRGTKCESYSAMQSPGCQLLLNLPEERQSLTKVKEPLLERDTFWWLAWNYKSLPLLKIPGMLNLQALNSNYQLLRPLIPFVFFT